MLQLNKNMFQLAFRNAPTLHFRCDQINAPDEWIGTTAFSIGIEAQRRERKRVCFVGVNCVNLYENGNSKYSNYPCTMHIVLPDRNKWILFLWPNELFCIIARLMVTRFSLFQARGKNILFCFQINNKLVFICYTYNSLCKFHRVNVN